MSHRPKRKVMIDFRAEIWISSPVSEAAQWLPKESCKSRPINEVSHLLLPMWEIEVRKRNKVSQAISYHINKEHLFTESQIPANCATDPDQPPRPGHSLQPELCNQLVGPPWNTQYTSSWRNHLSCQTDWYFHIYALTDQG